MPNIGIDVGTDSVRLCMVEGKLEKCLERPLRRTADGPRHTMCAEHLWQQIRSMVEEAQTENPSIQLLTSKSTTPTQQNDIERRHVLANGADGRASTPKSNTLCVAATCSMVVLERVSRNGAYFFAPVEQSQEVIVWMDTRALGEARELSRLFPAPALAQIGGAITPEMGIAKLKWVDTHYGAPGRDVCVFELYDWVTYVFMAGGYCDGLVRCLAQDTADFAPGHTAMDGSVKGWSSELLGELNIFTSVCCVPNTFAESTGFDKVGTPLGQVGNTVVCHGCIDCYAGWAGEAAAAPVSQCSLMMVAGTSTCFIASVNNAEPQPVLGLWGPFPQLLSAPVYSFGQPATGKLFDDLFAEHRHLFGCENPFHYVEQHAAQMEHDWGHPLPVLARHYMYYGDRHGNRSPYGDFRMGEVHVDGANGAGTDALDIAMDGSVRALVLRYYLLVEFLAFQTAQICQRLARANGAIARVVVSGSQAQNGRLVRMLAAVAFPGAEVRVCGASGAKFAGARGAAVACLAGEAPATVRAEPFVLEPCGARERQVLAAKFEAFVLLAEWQSRFRQTVGEL